MGSRHFLNIATRRGCRDTSIGFQMISSIKSSGDESERKWHLEFVNSLNSTSPVNFISQSAWATIAEYHRVVSLNNKNLLLLFWRPKVQDQGARKIGFTLRPLPFACRQPSSCFCAHMTSSLCVGRKRGNKLSGVSYIRALIPL